MLGQAASASKYHQLQEPNFVWVPAEELGFSIIHGRKLGFHEKNPVFFCRTRNGPELNHLKVFFLPSCSVRTCRPGSSWLYVRRLLTHSTTIYVDSCAHVSHIYLHVIDSYHSGLWQTGPTTLPAYITRCAIIPFERGPEAHTRNPTAAAMVFFLMLDEASQAVVLPVDTGVETKDV